MGIAPTQFVVYADNMNSFHNHATAVCLATAFTFMLFGALSNWLYA